MNVDTSSRAHKLTPNEWVRDARKQNHWTQKQLADKVGVTALTISRWERGETTPDGYARRTLCRVFNKNLEELEVLESKEAKEAVIALPPPIEMVSQPNMQSFKAERVRENNHMPFHEQLKLERKRRGWSQADLAKRLDTNIKNIRRWENGENSPQSYYLQKFITVFEKSLEELGWLRQLPSSTVYSITKDMLVPCGDCGRPEITVTIKMIVIDQGRNCAVFYCQLTNGTREDAGLTLESVSLTDSHGNFFLGRSVGSFLLAAGQPIPLSLVFDWVPEQETLYHLNIVLIRPGKWRNTYQPVPLTFKE